MESKHFRRKYTRKPFSCNVISSVCHCRTKQRRIIVIPSGSPPSRKHISKYSMLIPTKTTCDALHSKTFHRRAIYVLVVGLKSLERILYYKILILNTSSRNIPRWEALETADCAEPFGLMVAHEAKAFRTRRLLGRYGAARDSAAWLLKSFPASGMHLIYFSYW